MEEIEIKFLEIDIPEIESKLKNIGAEKIGETLSRITCFDYPDYNLHNKNAWVRLRTEFNETTIAYKERLGVISQDATLKDSGMKEVEIIIDNFEKGNDFLIALGMIKKFSQEKKRIRWQKNNVVFDIDTWPLTPTYLEIESDSWDSVQNASNELGLNYEEHLVCSAHNIFIKYGFNDHDYSVFTFAEQIKK